VWPGPGPFISLPGGHRADAKLRRRTEAPARSIPHPGQFFAGRFPLGPISAHALMTAVDFSRCRFQRCPACARDVELEQQLSVRPRHEKRLDSADACSISRRPTELCLAGPMAPIRFTGGQPPDSVVFLECRLDPGLPAVVSVSSNACFQRLSRSAQPRNLPGLSPVPGRVIANVWLTPASHRPHRGPPSSTIEDVGD